MFKGVGDGKGVDNGVVVLKGIVDGEGDSVDNGMVP